MTVYRGADFDLWQQRFYLKIAVFIEFKMSPENVPFIQKLVCENLDVKCKK